MMDKTLESTVASAQATAARLAASNGHHANGHAREPIGQLARDVAPEHVQFLWQGRLARAKPTILDGDPGLGKSTLTSDIAGRLTSGRPLPGSTGALPACGVVLLSAEDGAADTTVPRLIAAGADLERVFLLQGVRASDGTEDAVTVPADLGVIERAIIDMDAALLVIDPLVAYLGPDVNYARDQDVRRALAPLAAMLERTRCAALLIRHLNKAQASTALYRGGGSIGIIGAARFGLLVARDPDDDQARILAPTKCNIGPEPPALRYRLESVPGSDVARIVWDEQPAAIDATGLLAASAGSDEDRSAVSEAADWLTDYLADGPRPADDVLRDSRRDGIAERTLRRAKSLLKVESKRADGDTSWRWHLANTARGGQPSPSGRLGSLGSHRENPRNDGESGYAQGCQPEQRCQDCQGCRDDQGNDHGKVDPVVVEARRLATLPPDALARYRMEHPGSPAVALLDAAQAAGIAP